jgi:hypothetical protein
MLSDVTLSDVMLSNIMLSVIMLSVIMLNVNMLTFDNYKVQTTFSHSPTLLVILMNLEKWFLQTALDDNLFKKMSSFFEHLQTKLKGKNWWPFVTDLWPKIVQKKFYLKCQKQMSPSEIFCKN